MWYYWGVGQVSPVAPNSHHFLSNYRTFTEGLRRWHYLYVSIKRTIRSAWGWPESEFDKIKHDHLLEIYEEAKTELEDRRKNIDGIEQMFKALFR